MVGMKIGSLLRWTAIYSKRVYQMFIEKVAKPLYLSISHKLIALWIIIKCIATAFTSTFSACCSFLWFVIKETFTVFSEVVKSISKAYS